MKTWLKVTLSVLVVLGLAVGGAAWWLTRPTEAATYTSPVDQKAAASNSVALTALAESGIDDALTEVNDEYVLIAFAADSSEGDPLKLEGLMIQALGTAAGASDGAPKAIILAFIDQDLVMKWEADLVTFQDVVKGTMTEEAYLASVVRTT